MMSRGRWHREQARYGAHQLLLYHDLVAPLAGGRPLGLEFVVLTKSLAPDISRHRVRVDERQISRVQQIVRLVWRAISAGHFYPAPSAQNCTHCPFRRDCEAWPQ